MAGPLTMTKREREAYLADLHVGVISIGCAGRAPIAVPIWYDYHLAIGVRVITGEDPEKGRELDDQYVASGVEGEESLLVSTMRPECWRTVDYAKLAGSAG